MSLSRERAILAEAHARGDLDAQAVQQNVIGVALLRAGQLSGALTSLSECLSIRERLEAKLRGGANGVCLFGCSPL